MGSNSIFTPPQLETRCEFGMSPWYPYSPCFMCYQDKCVWGLDMIVVHGFDDRDNIF